MLTCIFGFSACGNTPENDGAEVKVRLASKKVILAMPHNNTFYDTLREKMMWGVDKR